MPRWHLPSQVSAAELANFQMKLQRQLMGGSAGFLSQYRQAQARQPPQSPSPTLLPPARGPGAGAPVAGAAAGAGLPAANPERRDEERRSSLPPAPEEPASRLPGSGAAGSLLSRSGRTPGAGRKKDSGTHPGSAGQAGSTAPAAEEKRRGCAEADSLLEEEDGAPGETTPSAPPLSPARAVCSPLIARRGHPAPAAPPARDGYIQRLLSRNFPGTASCDRTRSGASTATRGQPRADAPTAAAPCHAGASSRLKPSPPHLPVPAGPTLRPTRAADARRTRCLPVMLPVESGMAGGSMSFPVEHLTAGICCRISSLGCSEGATVCQECQLGHL
ncbi:collagen alpha-1(I) chain-like [Pezoporus wallicus]|uniref:collagen alpha-1(I) chain-like n=1 Tax=Pezoporus wallicus TaxID=35540 RepID=UPI00254AF90F|nr:collagen alpha-1(I) chain-like [Pezoporus wallicus]